MRNRRWSSDTGEPRQPAAAQAGRNGRIIYGLFAVGLIRPKSSQVRVNRVPYEVDDDVDLLTAYGESKLAGGRNAAAAWKHLIVRTSWVFGPYGKNFV